MDDTLKQVKQHSLDGVISFGSISYKDKAYIIHWGTISVFKGAEFIHFYSFDGSIWSLAIESDSVWFIGGYAKLFTFNPTTCKDSK